MADHIIEQIEDALIARINEVKQASSINADVESVVYTALAQSPQRNSIIVVWRGQEKTQPSTNSKRRESRIEFDLLLSKQNLRAIDIYPWVQALEESLIGWKPIPSASPIENPKTSPNNKYYADGSWVIRMELNTTVPYSGGKHA